MNVDNSKSRYEEDPETSGNFTPQEKRHLRLILRRLRFLEHQIRELGGLSDGGDGSGAAAFAEFERDALEWILINEMQYVRIKPTFKETRR